MVIGWLIAVGGIHALPIVKPSAITFNYLLLSLTTDPECPLWSWWLCFVLWKGIQDINVQCTHCHSGPQWMASVVTHTHTHTCTVGWVDTCWLFKRIRSSCVFLLFIVSLVSLQPVSYIPLPLSLLLLASCSLLLSPLVFLPLFLSLPLSHPLYILPHWENKEDSPLPCLCLSACLHVFEMYEEWY